MIKTPMTPDGEIDWAAFEDDVDEQGRLNAPTKRPNAASKDAKVHRFPCQGCGGSGLYRGGPGKCFACAGKGYFMTSERDRQQARKGRQERKQRHLEEAGAAFDEQHPGVRAFLVNAVTTWKTYPEFLAAQLEALNKYGDLTEGRLNAVLRSMAKSEERKLAWAAERKAAVQQVDLSPIRAMFEAAVKSGKMKPIFRGAGLVISRAPDYGRNPGALYVVREADDEYLGKIIGTQYTGRPAEALAAIAADPRGVAVEWGRKTSRCSCCGAELSNPESIEAGIGPICASKWGL